MEKIICPHCGAEYFPSEIFMPEDFLETIKDYHKNKEGIIEYSSVKNPDLSETYECDYCGKSFTVKAKLSFEVEAEDDDEDEFVELL